MIILFAHKKGGVGKSTVSINFAYESANSYKELTMLDLDSQNSAMLFNQLRVKNRLKTIKCITQDDIDFSKLVKQYSKNKENLLVIDSGGYDNDINRAALIKADMIITPVGLSQIEIFGLQKFRKILKDANIILNKNIKSHILLNNIDSRSKKAIKELKEYIKKNDKYFTLLESTLHTRADFKSSYGNGRTVKEQNKSSKATKEITTLTKEILVSVNN
jgi:chromosome partitioning protein